MTRLIFFDTETTGNTENDFLCQLAYKTDGETFTGLYKPPVKIPPEASAVHHITNKMVADKPVFKESKEYKKIKELFEDADTIVVAHNALFDLAMLKKEGIEPKKFICTLRVARHLDREEKFTGYRLQYLRYAMDIEVDATAHDALGDVLILEKLFERQSAALPLESMVEISSHPSLLTTFRFGKYNGKRVEDVCQTDRGYLEWLLAQKLQNESGEEDWIYTLKYYLAK